MQGPSGLSRWWGPVFDAERITRSRRWQGYAVRSLFVLSLLASLALIWFQQPTNSGQSSVEQLAMVGTACFIVLSLIQLVAALLIAPAATAGAICLDKSRGSLAHVFVTDLTNREIILGKLAARLGPVWALLACALPVPAMATLLGGIDPQALLAAGLIAAGVAGLGCSFALLLSVWATKTHEVLSLILGLWTLWLLACPVYQMWTRFAVRPPDWLRWSNPFYLTFAPYNYPGETSLVEPGCFTLGCLILGVGFTAMAVWKVRVVGCRSPRVGRAHRGWLARFRGKLGHWGPKLDRDPILWREWHQNRATRWSKVVWGGFGLISSVACCVIIYHDLAQVQNRMVMELDGLILGLITTVGLLLISTSTASVLAEERTRGSLDVLMSTPVSTRAILRAKWWGAFRRIPWLIFWPTLMGFIMLFVHDLKQVPAAMLCLVPVVILMQGAALVSLGLALATWIKRTGQATGWTIAVLIFAVVGWPIVGEILPLDRIFPRQTGLNGIYIQTVGNTVVEHAVATGSPFINVAIPYIESSRTFVGSEERRQGILILLVAWSLIYGLGAWLLFELTVLTFNRCLGRVSERPARPRLTPVGGPRWRARAGQVAVSGTRVDS